MTLQIEDLQKVVDAVKEHGSIVAAAEALGTYPEKLRGRMNTAARRGLLGTKPVLPGFEISKTSTTTNADGEVKSQTVQQKPEHGPEWEMPATHVLGKITANIDADGRVIQQWVRALPAENNYIEAIKAAFADLAPIDLVPFPPATDANLMSVYPIADQHNGLLSWGRETGESYDLEIGAQRLRTSAQRLIGLAPPSERALILNLGDWQHTDDQKNMTPRSGNILDVDSRYFKILVAGVQLMRDVIELALQKHGNVLVHNVPGNHDPHASKALTVALMHAYMNNPRVVISSEPDEFFFHRFGQTLIGATHGDKCKPDKMAMSMAVRRREDWGATAYHWFLFGHIHHETLKEVGDVRCESFQTLAAKDAYSSHAGYNSGQSLNCITLHVEDGEIGRHRVNIAPPKKLCPAVA